MYQCGLDGLLDASFRGVAFYVESDKEEYARRIVTHEFPMRDDPYHEDLGEKYQTFSVTGYVASDSSIGDKEAIKAACRQRGPGLLQLPAVSAFMAVCLTCSITRSLTKQGYFDVVMTFHADDGGASFQTPVAVYEQIIATFALNTVGVFTAAYDDAFNAFGVLPYVVANTVGIFQDFSNAVVDAVESTPLIGTNEAAAAVVRDAIGLYQGAPTFVQPVGYGSFSGNGVVGKYYGYDALTGGLNPTPPVLPATFISANGFAGPSATAFSGIAGSVDPSKTGGAFSGIAGSVDPSKTGGSFSGIAGAIVPSQALTNPFASAVVGILAGILDQMSGIFTSSDSLAVMESLASFSSGEVVAKPAPTFPTFVSAVDTGGVVAVSDQRNQDNAALINGTIRAFAAMQYGRAVAAFNYTNRSDAVQARADVVELFNGLIDVSASEATALALITVRDLTVKSLTTRITSLAAVETVSASSSMPSLYWAGRLYNAADRAQELIDRNDVPAPAFMPRKFEALVS